MNRNVNSPSSVVLALLVCSIIPVVAAVKTWDGGAVGDDDWSSNLNWSPNGEPVGGDSIVFPNSLILGDNVTNNDLAVDIQFSSLTITGGYRIGGNRFRLTSGITAQPLGTPPSEIDASVTLSADQAFRSQSGTTLIFGSTSTIDAGAFDLTLDANHVDGTLEVNGPLNGSGQVTISGPGEVSFSGAKGYTGFLAVNSDGHLRINNAAGLGSTAGGVTLLGRLILDGAAGFTLNEAITILGGGLETANDSGAGVFVVAQPISVAGGATFEPQGTRRLRINGVLSGSSGTSKGGNGILELAGASTNPFNGTFTAGIGRTELNKSGTAFALSGPVIVAGAITTTGELRFMRANQLPVTTSITVNDLGLLNLNGNNQQIANLTMIVGTNVQTSTGILSVSTGITILPGGQGSTQINGNLQVTQPDVFCDTEVGQSLSINALLSGATGTSSMQKTGDGYLTLNGISSLAKLSIVAGSVSVNSASSAMAVFLDGAIGELSGTGTVASIKANAGGVVAPIPQGPLTCGTVTLNAASALKIRFSSSAGVQTNSELVVNGKTQLDNANLIINWPSSNFTGVPGDRYILINKTDSASVLGIFNGRPDGSTFTDAGRTFFINYHGGDGNDVEITLLATPTGTTRTWTGAGGDNQWKTFNNWLGNQAPLAGDDLVFPAVAARKSNLNNFPLGTNFNSIRIESPGYLLNGAEVLLNNGLVADYTGISNSVVGLPITLTKHQTISAPQGLLNLTGIITLNGAILTFSRIAADKGFTVDSVITGTGGLAKVGVGTLVLSGASTFSAPMDVIEGTVAPRHVQAFGSTVAVTTFEAGTTLLLEAAGGVQSAETFVMLGGILTEGAGNQTLSGFIFFNGIGSVVNVGGTGTLTFSGSAGDPSPQHGGMSKLGPGTLIFSGNKSNSFDGAMTLAEGSIFLAKTSGAIALGGHTIVGTGTGSPLLKWLNSNQALAESTITVNHGIMDLNGQSDILFGLQVQGGQVTTGVGTLNLEDRLDSLADAISSTISGKINFNGSIEHELAVADGAAQPDVIISAVLSGNAGATLRKTGPGQANFTGNNTIGSITLAAGNSFFTGNSSTCSITLDGGNLSGTGTVGIVGNLSGGSVSPGASPGRITCSSLAIGAANSLQIELNGRVAAASYDQVLVGNNIILGNATLNLTIGTGFSPIIGDTFTILSQTTGSFTRSTFTGLPQNATFTNGGYLFQINYRGGDGNDVVLTTIDFAPPKITTLTVTPGTGGQTGLNLISIQGVGTPGVKYQVEKSADLQLWVIDEVATATATGALTYALTQSNNDHRFFFRLRQM